MRILKIYLPLIISIIPFLAQAQEFEASYYGEGFGTFQTGDFDGDNKLDVIAVNFNSSVDDIYILKNNYASGGTFTKKLILNTIDVQSNIVVFDYDKDGDLDIVLAVGSDKRLNVLLNDGKGDFTTKDLSINDVSNLSTTDVDGDGDIDIFGLNKFNKTKVLLTNTNGTYKSEKLDDVTTDEYLFTSEINHDPSVKLIAVKKGTSTVNFVRYISSSFGLASSDFGFTVKDNDLNDITMADINRDGTNDLILAGEDGINAVLLSKTENPKLKFIQSYSGSKFFGFTALTASDFNGDGYTDLVTTDQENIYYHANDGTGNFSQVAISTIAPAFRFKGIDVDGDKDNDIITSNGDLHVLLNKIPQLPNGVNDVTLVEDLIYPSLAQDILYIKTSFDYSNLSKYSIINSNGMVCQNGTLSIDHIEVSSLMSGAYFIVVYEGERGVMGRFVKR